MARPISYDKDEMLTKVTDLFWEKGYEGTSISDLEKVTGLKRTSIYAAWGDKRSLYLSSLKHYQRQSQAAITALFESKQPAIQKLETLLLSSIQQAFASDVIKGCFLNNACSEKQNLCTGAKQLLNLNTKTQIKLFTALLSEANENKEIHKSDDELEALARYFFTLFSGVMLSISHGLTKDEAIDTARIGIRTLLD